MLTAPRNYSPELPLFGKFPNWLIWQFRRVPRSEIDGLGRISTDIVDVDIWNGTRESLAWVSQNKSKTSI